jgi:hypothetical protein
MPRRGPQSDDQVAQVSALVVRSATRGRARRSPLFRWLMSRHDAFAAMLHEYPASWHAIADALATLGVTDGQGKAPTAERVRKTWWDARQHVTAKRTPESRTIPPSTTDEIARGVVSIRDDDRDAPRPRPRINIRPAQPRDTVAPAQSTAEQAVHAAPAVASSAPKADTDVQRILDAMDKHKPGIPGLITGED